MGIRLSRVFRFKKSLITVLVIAVAIGVTIQIVKSLEAPATGSVVQTPTTKTEVVDPFAKPGRFNGKYITFTYPAHYQVTPTALSGDYLEVAAYHFVGVVSRQINVGVYKGDLDTDGSVDFRKKHPEIYKYSSSSRWEEFTKLDRTEDTIYMKHGDLLVSVSATAPNASLNDEASYVASGLKWR